MELSVGEKIRLRRPQFQKMIDDADSFDVVVFWL